MNKEEKLKQEFALVERHHLVKGLFQTVPRGSRKTQSLELEYDLPGGGKLEIIAPQALRPFDAVMLCTVLCKAAQNKKFIRPGAKGKGKILREGLQLAEDSEQKDCMAYETTYLQLIKDMGLEWKGSFSIKQIEDSIKRMFFAGFVLKRRINGEMQTDMYHLISYAKLKNSKNTLAIGVNPILSEALISPAYYAKIDIEILRSLNPVMQLLYIMLCNAVDANNKIKKICGEDLRGMLYGPQDDNLSPATCRKQLSRAKKTAIALIEKLPGWQVNEEREGIIVKRLPQKRRIS